MHIALINSFPNRPHTAEREFIARFRIAAKKLGHKAYEVVTSNDVELCQPDFVIATHEFTPKLTQYVTLGAMWSPPSFYENDEERLKSILSYDGHLVGSPSVRKFIEDLEFSIGIKKPKSDFLFLPLHPRTEFRRPREHPWELVYIGVHWDGRRHSDLLASLDGLNLLNIYGPPNSWVGFNNYRGQIPFDGRSVAAILRRHGIALCLHKDEHRFHDTPSMRLFEAAAAGCLIITDEIPFARRVLGESVLYVRIEDGNAPNRVANQIAWANAHPKKAAEMATESHRLLSSEFSLESLVEKCCDFASKIGAEAREGRRRAVVQLQAEANIKGYPRLMPEARRSRDKPLVDVILRTGDRSPEYARRAIHSLAYQECGTYRIVLIDYKGRDDLKEIACTTNQSNLSIAYIRSSDTGFRSTATWTGLRNVSAPFFAMCDDDDCVMPDHFPGLLKIAAEHQECGFVYSGVIRVEEEKQVTIEKPHFSGPLGLKIEERRELKFLEAYDLDRLLRHDNYIQSNAWIARTELLDEQLLADPEMQVGEDVYLYLLLASKTKFMCNIRPTAFWNWRSFAQDNSMLSVDQRLWSDAGSVLTRRLRNIKFQAAAMIARSVRPHISRVRHISSQRFILHPDVVQTFGSAILEGSEHKGFHQGELEGTWTASRESSIILKLNDSLRCGSLVLNVMPAKPTHKDEQAVTISVNGRCICQRILPGWSIATLEGNFDLTSEVSEIRLTVACEYLTCPQHEGKSPDTRELGVFCRTIQLRTAPT